MSDSEAEELYMKRPAQTPGGTAGAGAGAGPGDRLSRRMRTRSEQWLMESMVDSISAVEVWSAWRVARSMRAVAGAGASGWAVRKTLASSLCMGEMARPEGGRCQVWGRQEETRGVCERRVGCCCWCCGSRWGRGCARKSQISLWVKMKGVSAEVRL